MVTVFSESRAPFRHAIASLLMLTLLTACGSRQVQDSLAGSTAQRLVSYAIDELAQALPEEGFADLAGQRVRIDSHFVGDEALRNYADERLAMELATRFDARVVGDASAERVLTVFYTSLGTDRDRRGFYLPLGFVPGVDESAEIDLLTLEQFHGIAELYYYLGEERLEEPLQARIRTDSLGLPIITIPLTTLP
ncbi:hypothetical protein HFP89_03160 [Wenzhouxiangella sp. XN79A]|uniref:hypothetical protein n=1 Tax=Wenzhouxiangella sp. XN79A TaxID=2724193 RepID=UPI00144A89EA|nr:hypothetical protein [Wenzhouxiangella sp. XN79A]NKI34164.1 hypothetical protein [Wenzhouxiangella sp. XN79A]